MAEGQTVEEQLLEILKDFAGKQTQVADTVIETWEATRIRKEDRDFEGIFKSALSAVREVQGMVAEHPDKAPPEEYDDALFTAELALYKLHVMTREHLLTGQKLMNHAVARGDIFIQKGEKND